MLGLIVNKHAFLIRGSIEDGIVRNVAGVGGGEGERTIWSEIIPLAAGDFDVLLDHSISVESKDGKCT